MKLSVIIVNYYAADMIADCLQSVYTYNNKLDFEVIVVNNSAGTGDKERLTGNFPKISWIEMGYNAGFARANNAGMLAATAPVVLLLNPDILAIDDSITRCLDLFVQSAYIACGVQLLNEDRTPQISGNYFMKGGLNHLLPLPYWGGFLRWIALTVKTRVPHVPEAKSVEEIDWISGAFLMIKKDILGKTGLMDEDFFLYAEEVEWCSRIRKIGKLALFGDLHVIHLQGEAINKDQQSTEKGYTGLFDKKGLQVMLSNHVRIRKQYGKAWFLFMLLNYTWGIPVYVVADFIKSVFTLRNPFAEWPRIFAFAKNVFYIWKLSPVIISNKPHFYKVL